MSLRPTLGGGRSGFRESNAEGRPAAGRGAGSALAATSLLRETSPASPFQLESAFCWSWSMLRVCVTSAAHRRWASRLCIRSLKIVCTYADTSSLATNRPRRISSDWSARENSRAVLKRSFLFFESAFITIFSRSMGYPRTIVLGRTTLHSWTFASVSRSLSVRNRRCPVVSSQRTTPRAKMSVRRSICSLCTCSGDMYASLPLSVPARVLAMRELNFAMPKSSTFVVPS
ncbi:MAG: hypothetical protein U0169_13760 [Polyangiaceae bacterium]